MQIDVFFLSIRILMWNFAAVNFNDPCLWIRVKRKRQCAVTCLPKRYLLQLRNWRVSPGALRNALRHRAACRRGFQDD